MVCSKFDEWNQSDSDSSLNLDVKQSIKSTAHQSARLSRLSPRLFMFVVRTRFPVKHSFVNVLRECYGKNLVKNNRTFEKYDFKYKEAIVDLDVLLICEEKNIIPKFLKFKVTNRQLKFSISISLLILSFKAYGTGRAL